MSNFRTFFSKFTNLFFFSFLNVLFHCLTSLERVNMFGALIIGNNFAHINHIGNWWKCHGDDRDGDDAPNLYLTMALSNYNAWRGFEAYVTGQQCFCITLKKCQQLYELNKFYSVRWWRWIKLTFPQNPDFVVLYSNFVQNQVTAPCNNCLAWHVLKDGSSVSILPFL